MRPATFRPARSASDMQELIAFVARFGGVFTFLFLESVCLVLLVRYNDDQRAIWLNTANVWSGGIERRRDDLNDFLVLREVTDSLAAENARLRLQLLLQPNVLPDAARLAPVDSTYTLLPTRVVRNSVMRANNTLTIDRGRADGVLAGQGVVSGTSVVGVTRAVGEHYAEVMSLLHNQSRISAALSGAGYFGVLSWRGPDVRHVFLDEVPRHAALVRGDTVITSGYSATFPRGITVGTVDSFWLRPGSDFYDVRVRLGHDPTRLDYAYVVRRARDDERAAFESKLPAGE